MKPAPRLLAMALAIMLAMPGVVRAAYPDRPIRIVVGFAPGGPGDISARLIAERLTESLKQPVTIENRPGSNGAIALQAVLAAPADGYTIMLGTTGTLTIAPAIMKKLPYDTLRDLTPVATLISYSYLLVTRNDLPVTSLKELVALAKSKPGQISYTSPGIGTVNHLGMEHFAILTGVKMIHVPYKGDSEAMTDIVGGHVDTGFISFSLTAPQAKAGKLRALAVSTPERSPILPDVPTVREAGVADFDLLPWTGLLVAKATPPEIVATLAAAVDAGLRHPEMVKRMQELGYLPMVNTPESFRRLIEAEQARWKKVADEVKISLD